jgi:hypothetical protein
MSEIAVNPLWSSCCGADVWTMTEPRWSIGCHDAFGRDRALTIFVEGDQVLLVPPPGAAAVLSPQQTRRLGAALDQAVNRAGERRVS